MKILNRILLPLVVALIALASATSAMAQGSSKTWMPEFQPDQHVYIDSRLEDHRTKPVSLPNLPAEIERAQKVHGLKVYVVATEQGSESSASSSLAATKLDELILKWRNDPNFPVDDYLVVMWVRFKDDPARGSVAANGGNRLRGYGMSASHFGSESGPVIPVLKQHMRERPELALTTIINNVNDEVTSALAAEENAKAREEALKELPGFLLKWGSILAGLLFSLFVLVRYFRARGRMNLAFNRFENKLAKVTELTQSLKRDHGKFLNAQKNWETRFVGTSLEKLKAGLAAYSELLSVSAAGSKRLVDARKAAGSYWFPRIQGALDAIELLTEKSIVVSSKEIELEMATLFGGLTVDKVVDPDDLFDNGSALNTTANDALNEIERTIALNEQSVATVRDTIKWVADQHGRFAEERLTVAPYQTGLDDLTRNVDAFEKAAFNDPLGLLTDATVVVEDAAGLKSAIERAFALSDAIEAASKLLAATVRRVDTIRQTAIEYKFPGETAVLLTKNYRLREERGDPTFSISDTAGLLMKAFDQLFAGAVDVAHETLESAKARREDCEQMIDAVFVAKEAVERDGHLVIQTKAELATQIEGAKGALANLKRYFLAVNFPDADLQYDGAVSTHDGTDAGYAEVKDAYDRQLYLLAARDLAQLLADIELARQDCTAVEDRLELLTTYREESRVFVVAAREHADRLGPTLKERSFTTSKAVDTRYSESLAEVAALETIVPQAIADWVDAHSRAGALKIALAEVEAVCDDQLAVYAHAYSLVGGLPANVESAYLSLNERTLQPAIDTHASVTGELEALSREIDVAKSDWKALRDRAIAAHKLCQTCRDQAEANDRQSRSAALHLAYCKVRARRFAKRKHKLLTEANRLYALARVAFAKRDWENACKLSIAAFKEFLKFDRHNKRRTATLVVKGAPGASSSAPATASGSSASSDDGYSSGIAIAIGMSMGSGNPAPTSSGSSSSSSSVSSTPSYTPSYSSDSGGGSFSSSSGGGSVGGGSGGGGY